MSQADGDQQRPPSSLPTRKVKKQVPQKTVDEFWEAFTTKFPGKVHTILPKNAYAKSKAAREPKGTVYGRSAGKSYEEAKADCVATVDKIAQECKRVNMRYRDPHFDIEFDLKSQKRDCLDGLVYSEEGTPKSVKRVPQIFEDPHFYVDGATSGDVRQGRAGDCWFLAALGALGNKKGLIDKVCVHREEKVGVYGFVFHRDGEWTYTVIDDKLYLTVLDWDEGLYEKVNWLQIPNRQDAEEEYRKVYQTGSRALYFAQCNTENETWLPLLEKAFAKAHGDYYSIDGGFTGEAVEDLTGGVTTELFTSDILDTDKFWNDELRKVNIEFLFGCATGRFDDWQGGGQLTDRKGIQPGHAYSIMKAQEIKGERLLLIRNPWGETEWSGPWSDGSEQWTPEWMQLLDHKFGDDGVFWISYKDLLRKYQFFDRTRLFGPEWKVTQQWVTVDVPWSADYNETKFSFTLTENTPIVIVLSQLDDRYWDGLQGQYSFSLHFRVSKDGEDGYIVRSHGNYSMTRSVSTELELEAGTYSVLMKITAKRYQGRPTVEDVIRRNCKTRREKLLQIGLAYDLAHAKGIIPETEDEKQRKAEQSSKAAEAARRKAREEAKKRKYEDWLADKKRVERARREKKRREEHKKRKEARKAEEARKREEGRTEASKSEGGIDEKTSAERGAVDEKDQSAAAVSIGADVEGTLVSQDLPRIETGAKGADQVPAITLTGVGAAAQTTPVVEPTANDGQSGVETPSPTEKETPPSDKPAEDAGQEVETAPTPPPEETAKAAQKASRATEEDPLSEESKKNLTAQDKIDQFNSDPALKTQPVPEVKVNGNTVNAASALPSPPPSPNPSLLPAPDNISDSETVITFASSIDSDLDVQYYREVVDSDDEDMDGRMDPEDDEDLAEYANDPWNAVCVVGLRVYTKEGDVSVKVVRPRDNDEEAPLDLDDPSKGLSDEAGSPTVVKVAAAIGEGGKAEGKDHPPLVEKLEDVIAGVAP